MSDVHLNPHTSSSSSSTTTAARPGSAHTSARNSPAHRTSSQQHNTTNQSSSLLHSQPTPPRRKSVTFSGSAELNSSLLSPTSNGDSAAYETKEQPTSSSSVAVYPSGAVMSDKPLSRDNKPLYSSLAMKDDDDYDSDGPPPLESAPMALSNNRHGHGGSSDDHGHSHSGGGHNHSHSADFGRNSRSSTPGTPKSPRRSPDTNCGGLKNRRKANKATAANEAARRQLTWAAICCCVFMVGEIIGGFLANSLAIMTDAAHLLSDLAGFLISIFALWLATRPATSRLSYGFHRAEILGALVSVLLIWLLTGVLVYEAIWRLSHPEPVDGKIMFIVATCGLIVNGAMGLILMQSGHGHSHGLSGGDHGHSHGGDDHGHSHDSKKKSINTRDDDHGHSHSSADGDHGHSHASGDDDHDDEDDDGDHKEVENMNVKAALIHVIGDALQSVGVMIAAGLIWYNPDWHVADPLCTFLFSILVLFTTTRLIRQSVGVLMEGVPEGIDPDEVEESLLAVPGVLAVHDLHIWSLSVGKPSLSVHLYARDDAEHLLATVNKMCGDRYNIHHSTIQIEKQHDNVDCNDAFIGLPTQLDKVATESFGQFGLRASSHGEEV